MASTQEAEIIFAQKLASNEKPVRSRALLKLRKYISARSQTADGFRDEELLKIWKGLFYCMWMQDKPLLQEDLSVQISRLLHSFRTLHSQLLYFNTFLQTMKREWNGIDRLRMDKFYQLVRFVFREVFEMLKRQEWESSAVAEFLQLFSDQLLQSSSAAPAGFIIHVLDLYMTELALVGSAELTAEQNQTFIEPFFKTMAKTKDRVLLKAIGSNIFSTIVDQVPFAIEDLRRELQQNAELDRSEDENERDTEEIQTETSETSPDCEEDGDEEECMLSEDMDDDDTCGPVLQFDYGAIADRLFEVASHSKIQSFNRSKIYKFVKIFRDLSEGVFPQDKVEKVSSDEDEFDDNSKKKRKRRKRKNKAKDEESLKKSKDQSESATVSDDTDISKDTKQKKKKRVLKRVEGQQTGASQETLEDAGGPRAALTGDQLESDAEPPQRDPENKPALNLQQRRKRTRKTCEDTPEEADGSEMEISVTSAEILTSVPLKKKLKLKRKARGAESDVTSACSPGSVSAITASQKLRDAASKEQTDADSSNKQHPSRKTPVKKRQQKNTASDEQTDADSQKTQDSPKTLRKAPVKKRPQKNTALDEQTDADSSNTQESSRKTPVKKRPQKNTALDEQTDADSQKTQDSPKTLRKAPVKKRQQKNVVLDALEPETNGDAPQEEDLQQPGPRLRTRRSQQKPAAVQIRAGRTRSVRSSQVNGLTDQTSAKRPQTTRDAKDTVKAKEFVLRQKKAPAPIFCKAVGYSTRMASKQVLPASKSELKKVTFGLKNNKTMEFRKMDRSSLLSPARQPRVAFDPKRTPKSGVLKSPSSSPAVTKRATAADFF